MEDRELRQELRRLWNANHRLGDRVLKLELERQAEEEEQDVKLTGRQRLLAYGLAMLATASFALNVISVSRGGR